VDHTKSSLPFSSKFSPKFLHLAACLWLHRIETTTGHPDLVFQGSTPFSTFSLRGSAGHRWARQYPRSCDMAAGPPCVLLTITGSQLTGTPRKGQSQEQLSHCELLALLFKVLVMHLALSTLALWGGHATCPFTDGLSFWLLELHAC
jgi:hypothetical protein